MNERSEHMDHIASKLHSMPENKTYAVNCKIDLICEKKKKKKNSFSLRSRRNWITNWNKTFSWLFHFIVWFAINWNGMRLSLCFVSFLKRKSKLDFSSFLCANVWNNRKHKWKENTQQCGTIAPCQSVNSDSRDENEMKKKNWRQIQIQFKFNEFQINRAKDDVIFYQCGWFDST